MRYEVVKLIIIVYTLQLLTSCSHKTYNHLPTYQFKNIEGTPDYSNISYWAAHPYKWDPSDSISKPFRKNYIKDSVVDVFYLYPTTLTDKKDNRWNAPIDDAIINAKTDYSAILYQASVFNEQCRVFAPRYRQAHLKAFYTLDTTKALAAFELAYFDVKTAFEYYLEHLNKGRPIIIAAHSQGTVHAARLMKEYIDGKNLHNKLVCAYLIGMPIKADYFKEIPSCKDSLNTGCYVSWRTYKKGYIDTSYIAKETFTCIVTNPLTWKTNEIHAPRDLNEGGVLKNFNKKTKRVVDAIVHGNILWTSKPKFFGNIFLTTKNYHVGDINLFYTNIRNNVKKRISLFWKK